MGDEFFGSFSAFGGGRAAIIGKGRQVMLLHPFMIRFLRKAKPRLEGILPGLGLSILKCPYIIINSHEVLLIGTGKILLGLESFDVEEFDGRSEFRSGGFLFSLHG